MNWIKERLSEDNFWNLMFILGVNLGIIFSTIIDPITFWIGLIAMVFILRRNAQITLKDDKIILNSRGEDLMTRMPDMATVIIMTAITFIALTYILSSISITSEENFSLSIIFTVPVLFFMYHDCPIAILFFKGSSKYKPDIDPNTQPKSILFNSDIPGNKHSSLSPKAWSTEPAYKHLGGNIHHRH